jgi:uncharacterized membrane protein
MKAKIDVALANGVPVPKQYKATAVGAGTGATLGAVIGAVLFGPPGAVVGAALCGGFGAHHGSKHDR